ncbi:MAG: EpsG family protein [Prevotella sp.]|nr:EpsG family protein [Prevotella sp.]
MINSDNWYKMFVYIFELILVFVCALYFTSAKLQQQKAVLAVIVLFVALVCGLGDMLGGYDRYIYGEVFDTTVDERASGVHIFLTSAFNYAEKEKGYALYNYLLTYITSNRYIFILITTLLVYAALYRHIIRYSKSPLLAFSLLFCIYYFFTFTYLRQIMALCVAWFSVPYAIRRKPIPFFAIIALAATFHNSALLAGGFYFIAGYRFSKKQVWMIVTGALVLGLTPVSSFLFNTLGGTVNEEKTQLSSSGTGGARIEYIIEAMFFLYIILRRYERIGKDKLSLCMLNIALGFIFVLCFFVRFQDGGRMSWFYLIGVVCTIAEILAKEARGSYLRIVTLSFMAVLYLRVLTLWGIQLSPYKTFLTNGIREGDVIEEMYEYDRNYSNDKLYRPVFGPIDDRASYN